MSNQVVSDVATETVPVSASVLTGDAETDAKVANLDNQFEELVSLAVDVLEKNNATRTWAAIGEKFLEIANRQRESFKKATDWSKVDYENLSSRLTLAIKMRVAVSDIRVDTYVRVHAFCEAVKEAVPDVYDLSYFQIANKFLPMFSWDRAELSGSVKKEWVAFCHATLRRQLTDDRLSIKALDEMIAIERDRIEGERNPSKAKNDATNARIASEGKVTKAIASALDDATVNPDQMAALIKTIAKERNLDVSTGLDPTKASHDDCKQFAMMLYNSGKLAEMVKLRDLLTKMIGIAESQAKKEKAA